MDNYETLTIELTSLTKKPFATTTKTLIKQLGFRLTGYCPCRLSDMVDVRQWENGLRNDDILIKINQINCSRATTKTIYKLIKSQSATERLTLTVYRSTRRERKTATTNNHKLMAIKKQNKIEQLPNVLFKCVPLFKCGSNALDATSYYQTQSPIIKRDSSSKTDTARQTRIDRIAKLIDIETDFLDYMSNGVSTFSRPLRGFFLDQQDYFVLFQNIEKLFVICESFLSSMQKWTPLDVYEHIGEFFNNKIKLLNDPLTTYARGYANAKLLLDDLQTHSKQFSAFLKETESTTLTLNNFLDMPIVYINQIVLILDDIRKHTSRNTKEYECLRSVIHEMNGIFANVHVNAVNKQQQTRSQTIKSTSKLSCHTSASDSTVSDDAASCSLDSPYSSAFLSNGTISHHADTTLASPFDSTNLYC